MVLAVAEFSLAGPPENPKKGLRVGDVVPISSMLCVVGEANERHTCLAGRYRGHRTFSIYVRSIEEPNLNALLKSLDDRLAGKTELRSYVLLLQGGQFNQTLKDNLRAWAKQQEFTRLDVAISNSNPLGRFGIAPETGVVVVYSDKLLVKYQRSFDVRKIDEAALEEMAAKFDELVR
jgi:hypothetical protein